MLANIFSVFYCSKGIIANFDPCRTILISIMEHLYNDVN